jgi:hypothetical protein
MNETTTREALDACLVGPAMAKRLEPDLYRSLGDPFPAGAARVLPDQQTEARIPPAHLRPSSGSTAQRLSRGALQPDSISILARLVDPMMLTALDSVADNCLPCLRVTGGVDFLRRSIEHGLGEPGFGPDWLAQWLTEDVIFLARLFQEQTGARRLQLRLEAVEDDACRCFHTDNVRF